MCTVIEQVAVLIQRNEEDGRTKVKVHNFMNS
jgi:hypothetical protein